jgi:hypothetical protein
MPKTTISTQGSAGIQDTGTVGTLPAPVTFADIGPWVNQTYTIRLTSNTTDQVTAHTYRNLIIDANSFTMGGVSHGVLDFQYVVLDGPGTIGQAYIQEQRLGVTGGIVVGTLYGCTRVLDSGASGTIANLVWDHIPDTSGSSTFMTNYYSRQHLDPRLVELFYGRAYNINLEQTNVPAVTRFGSASRYYPSLAGGGLSAGNVSRSLMIAAPPIHVSMRATINTIICECTTGVASVVARLGLYRIGADGLPSSLVIDAGTVSLATTGLKSLTFTAITLEPGLYFPVMQCTGGAADPGVRMMATNDAVLMSQYGAPVATPFSAPEDWLYVPNAVALPGTFGAPTRLRVGIFPAISIGQI